MPTTILDGETLANAYSRRFREEAEIDERIAAAEMRLPDTDSDAPSIKPRAFMHRTSDSCVTPAVGDHPELIYENPRVLVAWSDVADAVDWLEKGIAEWRAYAIEAGKQLAKLRAHQKDQMAALIAAEAFACRVRHWEEGKPDLHDIKTLLRDTIVKANLRSDGEC